MKTLFGYPSIPSYQTGAVSSAKTAKSSGRTGAAAFQKPEVSSDKEAAAPSVHPALSHAKTTAGTGYTRDFLADRINKPAAPAVKAPKDTYMIYLQTDDMLYSGGNGSGLSYYIKYAPDSTEEDPTVIAKGVDENGAEFEQTIHINDINPEYATLVEMHALEAHLGVDKNGGLTSLPYGPSMGSMGLHDRENFINMFENTIHDMTILKQRQAVAYYEYSMQAYLDFMYRK